MPIRHYPTAICFSLVMLILLASSSSYAIPAFSRQYGTSCSTCHVDFPKLNDFGKAFKDAGFKFPKDDETFLKVPPIMLGAPAQKDIWPHTIFPGTIPGLPPIGIRFNTFFQVVSKNRNDINAAGLANPGTFIPRTDFQPGLFSRRRPQCWWIRCQWGLGRWLFEICEPGPTLQVSHRLA